MQLFQPLQPLLLILHPHLFFLMLPDADLFFEYQLAFQLLVVLLLRGRLFQETLSQIFIVPGLLAIPPPLHARLIFSYAHLVRQGRLFPHIFILLFLDLKIQVFLKVLILLRLEPLQLILVDLI